MVLESQAQHSFDIFISLIKGKCIECEHQGAFPCESIGCERCTLACPCAECKHLRAQGLCFTMRSPLDIRMSYALQTTPIFWISHHGRDSIDPAGLEVMSDVIQSFMKQSRNPVVLLDGIEHLMLINGALPVLRFLKDIQEYSVLYDAILILPVNPLAIEKKELALIQRNMKLIE
ncbi:MAG: DUF835 domain-containing protein [Methanotrichaceae archaeon]|nr:DUF835 domain-containing protein [Methanotrichaceae archaeon]